MKARIVRVAPALPGRPPIADADDPRGLSLAGGTASPGEAEASVDAAFQEFYEQVTAFSRDMRARLGEPNPTDVRLRAAANVHLAQTMFGKWSLEILSALYGARSIGFEDLRRTLHGITSSVLSYRLKRMESHGLVAREVETTRPVRVRYRLTIKGLTVAALGEPVFLFLQYTGAKERRDSRVYPRHG